MDAQQLPDEDVASRLRRELQEHLEALPDALASLVPELLVDYIATVFTDDDALPVARSPHNFSQGEPSWVPLKTALTDPPQSDIIKAEIAEMQRIEKETRQAVAGIQRLEISSARSLGYLASPPAGANGARPGLVSCSACKRVMFPGMFPAHKRACRGPRVEPPPPKPAAPPPRKRPGGDNSSKSCSPSSSQAKRPRGKSKPLPGKSKLSVGGHPLPPLPDVSAAAQSFAAAHSFPIMDGAAAMDGQSMKQEPSQQAWDAPNSAAQPAPMPAPQLPAKVAELAAVSVLPGPSPSRRRRSDMPRRRRDDLNFQASPPHPAPQPVVAKTSKPRTRQRPAQAAGSRAATPTAAANSSKSQHWTSAAPGTAQPRSGSMQQQHSGSVPLVYPPQPVLAGASGAGAAAPWHTAQQAMSPQQRMQQQQQQQQQHQAAATTARSAWLGTVPVTATFGGTAGVPTSEVFGYGPSQSATVWQQPPQQQMLSPIRTTAAPQQQLAAGQQALSHEQMQQQQISQQKQQQQPQNRMLSPRQQLQGGGGMPSAQQQQQQQRRGVQEDELLHAELSEEQRAQLLQYERRIKAQNMRARFAQLTPQQQAAVRQRQWASMTPEQKQAYLLQYKQRQAVLAAQKAAGGGPAAPSAAPGEAAMAPSSVLMLPGTMAAPQPGGLQQLGYGVPAAGSVQMQGGMSPLGMPPAAMQPGMAAAAHSSGGLAATVTRPGLTGMAGAAPGGGHPALRQSALRQSAMAQRTPAGQQQQYGRSSGGMTASHGYAVSGTAAAQQYQYSVQKGVPAQSVHLMNAPGSGGQNPMGRSPTFGGPAAGRTLAEQHFLTSNEHKLQAVAAEGIPHPPKSYSSLKTLSAQLPMLPSPAAAAPPYMSAD